MIWKTRRRSLDLAQRAQVMGILNVTPDSFSDGGCYTAMEAALAQARKMIAEGAELIDIGGESTRPGALRVPAEEEISRIAPIVEALRDEWDGLISIDTWKASVAEAALVAGADLVNDISGLKGDPEMAALCAASGCGVVVMHLSRHPHAMHDLSPGDDVVEAVQAFYRERLETLTAAGLAPEALCFDPGIGFGKTLEQNLALLRALDQLAPAGFPQLLGVSRKSFIGKVLGESPLSSRDWPTTAITSLARAKGVMVHRVHLVKPNLQALRMTEAILQAGR